MTATAAPAASPPRLHGWRRAAFLAMVAVLPLHTLAVDAWVSWRPFLVLLVVLAAADAVAGWRRRRWPWHVPASIGGAALLAGAAASWPGSQHAARFAALWLALGVGLALLLVVERALRPPGTFDALLTTVYWSGAALAASAVVLGLVTVGAFGQGALDAINDLPLVDRVGKPTYLPTGFVALTGWHQDPGYAAAWFNLWFVLGLAAIARGLGSRRAWVDAAILGGLGYGVVMTFSRTGWLSFVVAAPVALALLYRRFPDRRRELVAAVGGGALVALLALGLTWAADQGGVAGDLDEQFSFRLGQGLELGVVTTDQEGADVPFEPDVRADVWPQYVDYFRDDPLRGAGLGTGWATPGVQEPHSLVLQLLGETGLVGMAGFLALAGVLLASGRGLIGWLALGTALLPSVTQTVLFEPTWWLAAGLLLAGGRAARRVAIVPPGR